MQGKSTIGGKMGVTIKFEMEGELGKSKNKVKKPILKFKAALKADAYFGGDFIFDSDKKGLFIKPVLKFSGVMLIGEIEGEIGWWKSNFKIEEKIIEESIKELGQTYF
ncbi:hypothetical protein FLBR109950_00395 [Flavobacterium branchiophilum]|uniref:hypothetical protein n=1 Tax=Flavobacterium branchiophilum TaxID=55197 RepID=UPI00031C495A|nr:hypothetical protein [Flavobacterium branchiophilum]